MTVQDTIPYIDYVYTGPGDYSFPFPVYDEVDVTVYYTDTTGQVVKLVLGLDYTVVLNSDSDGGVCTLSLAETVGGLRIEREVPYTQDIDWVNNEPFNMEILERSFDEQVMMIQQLAASLYIGLSYTNWLGTWNAGVHYKNGDVVQAPNSNYYACSIEHVASSDFNDDLSNGYWKLVIDIEYIEGLKDDAEQAAAGAANSESNALQSAEDAQASAEAALASANYKGRWSDLTGSMTIPASVSHNEYVWMLQYDIDYIDTHEPGYDPAWINITPVYLAFISSTDAPTRERSMHFVDATNYAGSHITISLPNSPSIGQVVKIQDFARVCTHDDQRIMVEAGSENIMGVAEPFYFSIPGMSIEFMYSDTNMGWVIIGGVW